MSSGWKVESEGDSEGPFQAYVPLFPAALNGIINQLEFISTFMHLLMLEFADLAGANRGKTHQGLRVQQPVANSTHVNVPLQTLCRGAVLSCFPEQSLRLSLPLGSGI